MIWSVNSEFRISIYQNYIFREFSFKYIKIIMVELFEMLNIYDIVTTSQ